MGDLTVVLFELSKKQNKSFIEIQNEVLDVIQKSDLKYEM